MYGTHTMNAAVIAERKLLFSLKGNDEKKSLSIRVFAPHLVEEGTVNFQISPGMARCVVAFVEIDQKAEFYGMDSVQALALTANLDEYLKHFDNKYDFFWLTGEPYFED
jgi:hypothetical protein